MKKNWQLKTILEENLNKFIRVLDYDKTYIFKIFTFDRREKYIN